MNTQMLIGQYYNKFFIFAFACVASEDGIQKQPLCGAVQDIFF